jgi:hypothetical protein
MHAAAMIAAAALAAALLLTAASLLCLPDADADDAADACASTPFD